MDWTSVEPKTEVEAFIPEVGDKISTLNGVENANADTVVIRQRHTDEETWHVFITDRDTFDKNYDHDLFSEESESEDDAENQESVEDTDEAADAESDTESEYWNLTVPELRSELEKRDLDNSGNKPELVARLESHDSANES